MPPSYNHSYLAYRLAKLMYDETRFNLHIEITIDINGADYIPDIAVYPRKAVDFLHDKIKTELLPLLIVAILSPQQSVNEIMEKFELFLQAGIQSCWLVIPPTKTIIVFNDIQQPQSYSKGFFEDIILQKEIAVEQIFK